MGVFPLPVSVILLLCTIFPSSYSSHEMISQHGKVVELTKSKEDGARLLSTKAASDLNECSHLCLGDVYCNTAVYHENDFGRHNCFLLWCGVPNKCSFSNNVKYTTLFRTSMDSEELQPVDCQLSSWMVVTPCSVTCGHGIITYRRTIVKEAKNGGKPCSDDDQLQTNSSCSRPPCNDVDCHLSDWSYFTECSATCGGGEKTRFRSIVQPNRGSGVACPPLESLQQSVPCEETTCLFWGRPIQENDDQNSPAADVDSIIKEEFDEVIDENQPTVDDVPDQTSSPPELNQTEMRHPSTTSITATASDMQTWEQELIDEADELDDQAVNTGFSKKINLYPTHISTLPTTEVDRPQTPTIEQPAKIQLMSTQELLPSLSNTPNIDKSMQGKQSVNIPLTGHILISKVPSTSLYSSESTLSVKQKVYVSVAPVVASQDTDGWRTKNPVSLAAATDITDIKTGDGIELNAKGLHHGSSDATITGLLVLALIVGILFMIASFMVMAKHWYGSRRRGRLHTQMEYLLNDVSD